MENQKQTLCQPSGSQSRQALAPVSVDARRRHRQFLPNRARRTCRWGTFAGQVVSGRRATSEEFGDVVTLEE